MPGSPPEMRKLFVIMPFGVRIVVDSSGSQTVDFDLTYSSLIKAAGEAAGWNVLRIDEIAEPGVITDQYLREILEADLVLADISAQNANVFYELGVRQAISTGGTILIALKGTQL